MSTDQFDNDLKVEVIISLWIEENYFEKESNNYKYIRCEDIEKQKQGVDAAVKNPNVFKDDNFHYIDEKAASSYIKTNLRESNLPTFAFELDSKRYKSTDTEDRVPGWLFGDAFAKTEYYLLSWIWADVKKKKLKEHDLRKVKCILVSKKAIQNYVVDFGINKDNFMEKAKETRFNPQKKIFLSDNDTIPNMQHSSYLEESPVNIIIRESVLNELAIDSFTVTL